MENRSWFKFYPEGIPHEIDPDKYSSIPHLLEESFKEYTSLVAYESMGKQLTFSEVDSISSNWAWYFQKKLGLKKGDRIAIQMPNLLQYPVVMFGALRAGLVVVNTNPLYTPREMEHQFKDSGAKAIVILANFAYNLQKVIDKTDIRHVIITEIGDMLGGIKGGIVNFVVKKVKKMVPVFSLPNAISFKKAMAEARGNQHDPVEISNTEPAYLQYTGGTTGVSKGAILTHRNIVANMEQISAWMIPKLYPRQETIITPLPLYHIFALTVNCLSMLKIGAKNVLIANPRDMKAFIKELKKHKFTVFSGVNTLFNGLLNQEDFRNMDCSNLKVAVGGAMAVQRAVSDRWRAVTGNDICEGYGLTEASPVVTCNPIDGTERIGTIGLPLPSTDVKILDDDKNEVPLGEPGELYVKGPQVMYGYWGKPDINENLIVDGWLETGDMATIDEDGYLKIVDRKKEMINVSGFNVYPNEVEGIIAEHPKVLEVGAVGVPDENSTEVVKVFVVRKDPSLTEEEVLNHCRENLTNYKRPKLVEFRDELPKSNVGKILRRKLKEPEKV